MFKKIINFVKYNNAFSIGFTLLFSVMTVSLAASPELRENVYNSESTISTIDNHKIISTNLDSFNFNLKVNSVTEDGEEYFISYSYKTIAIEDGAWKEKTITKIMDVNKKALAERDLGLYVAEELRENINYELSYLKRVQEIEKGNGISNKTITTKYAGLVGKFLDPKEKVILGYEPVIPAPIVEIIKKESKEEKGPDPSLFVENDPNYQKPDVNASSKDPIATVTTQTFDENSVRQIVQNMLSQYRQQNQSAEPVETAEETTENTNPQLEPGTTSDTPTETIEPEPTPSDTTTEPITEDTTPTETPEPSEVDTSSDTTNTEPVPTPNDTTTSES